MTAHVAELVNDDRAAGVLVEARRPGAGSGLLSAGQRRVLHESELRAGTTTATVDVPEGCLDGR